jgi:hypothetical protein
MRKTPPLSFLPMGMRRVTSTGCGGKKNLIKNYYYYYYYYVLKSTMNPQKCILCCNCQILGKKNFFEIFLARFYIKFLYT